MNYSLTIRQLCFAVLACAAQSSFAQSYTVTPVPPLATGAPLVPPFLPLLGAPYGGLNAVGSTLEVVGSGYTSTAKGAPFQAFSASGPTTTGSGSFTGTDLGTLAGTRGNSVAYGVNAAGQAVGWSSTPRGVQSGSLSIGGHAFVTQSTGGLLDLGTLAGAPFGSAAFAINATGEVVGASELDLLHAHAVAISTTPGTASTATTKGPMTDLGALVPLNSKGLLPLLSQSMATAVNASGMVVGWSLTSSLATHAFAVPTSLTVEGGVIPGTMIDLGTLAGPSGTSNAAGINDNGFTVGYSTTSGGMIHAFSIPVNIVGGYGGSGVTLGVMKDLGTLGGNTSQANAVNNSGTIVGSSTIALPTKANPNPATHAFIYQPSAQNGIPAGMSDLNNAPGVTGSGWILTAATAIDANGDILATGSLHGGPQQQVVMQLPPQTDYGAIYQFLAAISPGVLTRPWTDIFSVLFTSPSLSPVTAFAGTYTYSSTTFNGGCTWVNNSALSGYSADLLVFPAGAQYNGFPGPIAVVESNPPGSSYMIQLSQGVLATDSVASFCANPPPQIDLSNLAAGAF